MSKNVIAQTALLYSRYHLQEKLGQGAMGVVYQAIDRLNGETVALKRVTQLPPQTATLRDTGAPAKMVRLALAREFQILAGLRHPNIISVLDYGFGLAHDAGLGSEMAEGLDGDSQPFFTMTYLANPQTLLEAAEGQSFATKIALLQQMLQALAYLHRRQVIHRDLKPANVLVQAGTVRVLDFGLAETTDQALLTGSSGTPLYMAPELFNGKGCSIASDLFAVGVLATQMLTGTHPFAPFDFQFLDRVFDKDPNLAGMDERLYLPMMRLLAKRPERRIASADEVLSLLQRILTPSDNTQTASISMPLETPAIRESYLQAATFVGRETEMTQLQCALAKAKEGAGSAWLVGGESGVGKSRLLQEVRTHALVNGFLVLTGQANENGDSFYELWRTPLRQLLLTLPQISDLDAGVLMPIIPDIADLLGREIPSAPPLDGEAAQTRLFVTITQLLTETPQPVLLMLEDLHWATASLLPLPYLTRALTDTTDPSSLVVIGSYRDDERPELAQTLADMQPLHLKRLTEDNMADLAAAMLGELGQRPDIVQRLQQETEGNAFFAVEVLRTLAEDMGGLTHIGDAPLPDMLLPDGIQSIVQRRLARVPQEDQPLLQLAAVAGRTLDMSLLQTLNGGQEIAERWLHTCAEVAMLEVVDDSWQFQHAKMRDGLLAMIPAEIVKQHHQQVAEAIEQVYPDDPRYAAQLMVHWRQAENPEKEFTYAYQAGTHAASQYANEDAIMYLTQAYELNLLADWIHDKQYMQRQYDVLLAREEIYALIGQRDPQKTDLALLAALADTLGQPSYQAEVALRHGEYADSIADYAASHDYAQIAIDKAQCANNTPILTKAYRLMGDACFAVGEHERAETALEQALTLVDHTANAIEKGKILNSLGEIAQKKSAYRQAMTYYQQSLHIYTTISDEQGQAQTLRILGGLMRLWGNEQEGLAYSEKSLEIFERIGDKTGEGTVTCNIGGHWSALGAFDTANAFYQRSLMVYQQIGDKSGMSVTLMGLAFTARIQEQVEEAYQYYRQGLQINQELGDRYVQAAALVNLGNIWRNQTGVFEQAKAHLEQSIAISHQLEVVDLEAYGLVSLGALFNQLGYYQKAQSYLEDILITFREIERRDQERETLHNLCNSLIAQRMFERAKQTLQEAVDISRELGYAWIWVGTGLNHLGWIAYQEGEYEQMLAYYEEAQTTLEAGTSSHEHAMSLAGIAWAKCLLGYTVVASDILPSLAHIENTRPLLNEMTLFRLHLICYKLLEAIDDPLADVLLTIAHEQIQQIASYIETPEWRESFLTNVPEQRALEQCYWERIAPS